MAQKKREHYATRLKRKLAEANEHLNSLYEYRFRARFTVLGEYDEVYGGNEMFLGREETMPCRDVGRLREIILNWPV